MTANPAADTLRLIVQPARFMPRLTIVINGEDLVATQRPLGSIGQPMRFIAPTCAQVLPPDAVGVLPTTRPTRAMVAVCGCGSAGCDSLWVRVSRTGGRVNWSPDDGSPHRTVDRTWSFELLPYLDAVDGAVAANARLERRAHTVARELRRRRDSLPGVTINTREQIFDLRDAYATRNVDDTDDMLLAVRVAGADGIGDYLVPLPENRSDDDILGDLDDFDPARYRCTGLVPWMHERR